MIKYIIFDFDGTLFDTEPLHLENRIKFINSLSLPNVLNEDDIMGRSVLEVVCHLFKKYNIDMDPLAASQMYFNSLLDLLKKRNLKPNEGVIEVLEFCQKHDIKMAVASSSIKYYLEDYLKYTNIRKYFDYVLGYDDVEKAKPEPDLFNKSISLLNGNNDETIIIEDSLSGVIAGNKANIKVIGYDNPSDSRFKQDLSKSYKIIHSFYELIDYIKEENHVSI